MNPQDYKTLFELVRRYQIEKTVVDSKLYHVCEQLLDELWPYYYTQKQEQCR